MFFVFGYDNSPSHLLLDLSSTQPSVLQMPSTPIN
jgi:hypothetical protein